MQLQYMLANGNWRDVSDDRKDYFLNLCMKTQNIDSIDDVIEIMKHGHKIRNGTEWYSFCRIKPLAKAKAKQNIVKCACGHSVLKINVMSTSSGTSCPDCYDKMSF